MTLSNVNLCSALYNIDMGWGFQILFTLSSQLIGIAFAGLFRRFLIWYVKRRRDCSEQITDHLKRPAAMIWPLQFSNISLFFALHDKSKPTPENSNGWRISQYRWFLYVLGGAFVWYWYATISSLFQAFNLFQLGFRVSSGKAYQCSHL